ncbi:MAG: hypothetical protein ACR2M0_04350 [Chloroflexia bacterium]
MTQQESNAKQMEHKTTVHTHDHWHVSHHHIGQGANEFEHRSTYHTHEHSHSGYEFEADHPEEHSDGDHASKAHVHDHSNPVGIG